MSSSGTSCPMCGRHMSGPECLTLDCGYVEGPPDLKRLTKLTPRKRSTDEGSFTMPAREALARMEPDTREAHRRGIAEARAELARAAERKQLRAGWMREVVNVETGSRL